MIKLTPKLSCLPCTDGCPPGIFIEIRWQFCGHPVDSSKFGESIVFWIWDSEYSPEVDVMNCAKLFGN